MPKLTYSIPRMGRDHNTAVVHIDGRRVRLGRWGTPEAKEAYDRLVAEWLAHGRRLPFGTTEDGEDEPVTVTEVCVAYLRHARRRRTGGDLDHIEAALKLLRKLYGSEPAETFGPKRLRVVRDQIIAQNLARSTINKRVQWIRSAFRWAASHELVSERIYRRLDTVDGLRRGDGGRETPSVKPVSRRNIRLVRRYAPRPVRGLIDLQLLTGARAAELVRLRAVDIDTTGEVWTYRPENHKTAYANRERIIYFGPRAQKVLKMFMALNGSLHEPLFSPKQAYAEAARRRGTHGRRPNQKPNPKKTQRSVGNSYTTASYRRAIHRVCKQVGIERWGPHRLRHNAATFLRREYGIEVASIILGHSSLAVTQTYAEQNHRRAIEVMKQVG